MSENVYVVVHFVRVCVRSPEVSAICLRRNKWNIHTVLLQFSLRLHPLLSLQTLQAHNIRSGRLTYVRTHNLPQALEAFWEDPEAFAPPAPQSDAAAIEALYTKYKDDDENAIGVDGMCFCACACVSPERLSG